MDQTEHNDIHHMYSKHILKIHSCNICHENKLRTCGPSFLQFLNKLFQIQIATGDIIQFESADNSKYYMLSATETWDEIIKL